MRLHQQEWLWQHAFADACWLQVLHFTVTLVQKVLAHHRPQHHNTLSVHSWHATSLGGQPTLLLRRAVEAIGCAQPTDAGEISGFVSMESQSTDEACTGTGPVGVACRGALSDQQHLQRAMAYPKRRACDLAVTCMPRQDDCASQNCRSWS